MKTLRVDQYDTNTLIKPNGKPTPRCPAKRQLNEGGMIAYSRCRKPTKHLTRGDNVHSTGTFTWPEHGPDRLFLNRMMVGGDHAPRVSWEPIAEEPKTEESILRDWWIDKAKDETDMVVTKAIEYGATDLLDIGRMLARTMKREVDDQEAAELGVFFYLIGKVSRWQSAIERGDRPSGDTLLDIGVYVRMAQRIRHSGGWPGTKDESNAPEVSNG